MGKGFPMSDIWGLIWGWGRGAVYKNVKSVVLFIHANIAQIKLRSILADLIIWNQ